jgi:hypothetical protein
MAHGFDLGDVEEKQMLAGMTPSLMLRRNRCSLE